MIGGPGGARVPAEEAGGGAHQHLPSVLHGHRRRQPPLRPKRAGTHHDAGHHVPQRQAPKLDSVQGSVDAVQPQGFRKPLAGGGRGHAPAPAPGGPPGRQLGSTWNTPGRTREPEQAETAGWISRLDRQRKEEAATALGSRGKGREGGGGGQAKSKGGEEVAECPHRVGAQGWCQTEGGAISREGQWGGKRR